MARCNSRLRFLGVVSAAALMLGCATVSSLLAPGDPLASCRIDSLAEAIQVSPESFAVVDAASVELRWSYPEEYCNPEGFEVYLSETPGFGFSEGEPTFETFIVDGGTRQVMPTDLEPGKAYWWRVKAYSSTLHDIGAEAEAEIPLETEYGPYSPEAWRFFTGPVCHVASLIAPEQVSPADGVTVTTTRPGFEWSYPDPCVPDRYIIHLATDPSFSDPSLNGFTSRPSTSWGAGSDLETCTWYFWRVRASVDDTPGPLSPTWSFFVPPGSTPGPDCDPSAPPPLPPPAPISGDVAAICGNGVVESGEGCEEDGECGAGLFCGDPGTRAPCQCLPTCGDGLCASYESPSVCPQDCGSDLPAGADGSLCGDGVCQAGESPDWCGDCVPDNGKDSDGDKDSGGSGKDDGDSGKDDGDGQKPPSQEPVCGNGSVEAGEQCDPPGSVCYDKNQAAGQCAPDCSCQPPI